MAQVTGVLADTSALARAHVPVVAGQLAELRNVGRLWTCDVVTLELGYSARSHAEWQAVQSVQRLLPTADVSAEVTRRAREVQGHLARTGHDRIPLPDLLIAAAAESEALEILHYDRDFEAIAGATGQTAHWIAEPGTID